MDRTKEELYRVFRETRQEPLRLAAALEGFFRADVDEVERGIYGTYLRKRIRPAAEKLIETEDTVKLERLAKCGWFGVRELDGFIRTARERGKTASLLWLLHYKDRLRRGDETGRWQRAGTGGMSDNVYAVVTGTADSGEETDSRDKGGDSQDKKTDNRDKVADSWNKEADGQDEETDNRDKVAGGWMRAVDNFEEFSARDSAAAWLPGISADQMRLAEAVLVSCRNDLYRWFPSLDAAFAGLVYRNSASGESVRGIGTDGDAVICEPQFVLQMYAKNPARLRRGYLHMLLHCLYLHPFAEKESGAVRTGGTDELQNPVEVQSEDVRERAQDISGTEDEDICERAQDLSGIEDEGVRESARDLSRTNDEAVRKQLWDLACDIAVEQIIEREGIAELADDEEEAYGAGRVRRVDVLRDLQHIWENRGAKRVREKLEAECIRSREGQEAECIRSREKLEAECVRSREALEAEGIRSGEALQTERVRADMDSQLYPGKQKCESPVRGVFSAEQIYQLLCQEAVPYTVEELERVFRFDDHALWRVPGKDDQTIGRRQKWEKIRTHAGVDGKAGNLLAGLGEGGDSEETGVIRRSSFDYRKFLSRFTVAREEVELDTESFDYIFYSYGMEHYGNLPLIEPLEYREVNRLEELVIAIDTSGSCSMEMVRRFLAGTYAILSEKENFFRKMEVHLIQCDCVIQNVTVIHSGEEWRQAAEHVVIQGRGGTDFTPVFRYIRAKREKKELKRLRALIYFTDGDGVYPSEKPDYETAFVFVRRTRGMELVPPWARTLVADYEAGS